MNREITVDAVGLHERASATPEGDGNARGLGTGTAPEWTRGKLSLAAQQAWFAAIVSTPAAEAAPVDVQSAERLVTPSSRLSALERIEIYRRAYHARLIECLLDDYPVLAAAVGEAAFETLCLAYIARHPSSGPSLNVFGRHMAAFCRSQPLREAGFASDLATLEWAIVESIHAPSVKPLSLDDLSTVPTERWPGARFGTNPSLQILSLDYPVNAYLHAHRRGEPLPAITEKSCHVAVYRTGRDVWRTDLELPKLLLLKSLVAAATLQEALETTQAALATYPDDEAARLVSGHFQHSISSGLFCSVSFT